MGVVVASFVLATAYGQLLLSSDADALSIAYNAGPSIAALADARAELARLGRDAQAAAGDEPAVADAARADFRIARRQLDTDLAAYLALPEYPGERARYRAVPALLARLAEPPPATSAAEIAPAVRALDGVLAQLSALNQEQLASSAQKIPLHLHRHNLYSFALDGVGILVALVAWLLVARVFERYVSTIQRRSKELEHLAVQVGHEIANPLMPIQIALRLADEEVRDEVTRTMLARARRSLGRIAESIDGLTTFARAGLVPTPRDEHAPLGAAVDAAARAAGLPPPAGIDPAWRVGCAEPALRELLARFFAGAADGGGPPALEVSAHGRRVRVTVAAATAEATPPGSAPPPAPEPQRPDDPFDPQLRDAASGQPGIDLRLATVRRMVQARGGSVGARRGRQQRALWIELPRA